MAFEEQLPQWENEGTQPPQSKRVEGWLPNEKPPASWFNWLLNRTYKALKELQEKAGERVDVEQAQQTADSAAAAAADAQQTAESHASRHASDGPDPITPGMIGAETPAGAQAKADAAEQAANLYTDQRIGEVEDDIKTPDSSYTPSRTINVAGDLTRDMQAQFMSHKAETVTEFINAVTGFGADPTGTNDSIDALQSAVNEAVGKILYLPPGVYKTTKTWALPSNTMIIGYGAVLKPVDASSFPTYDPINDAVSVEQTWNSRPILSNSTPEQGNKNIAIYGLQWIGNNTGTSSMHGLHVFNVDGLTVQDCITDECLSPIAVLNSRDVRIIRNKIKNFRNGGVDTWHGCKRVQIIHNIIDCTAENSDGSNVGILCTAEPTDNEPSPSIAEDYVIANNIITNAESHGIWVGGGDVNRNRVGDLHKRINVHSNIIRDCGQVGIILERGEDCIIRNNIIVNTGWHGIYTRKAISSGEAYVDRPVIADNLIRNVGLSISDSKFIHMDDTTRDAFVYGNRGTGSGHTYALYDRGTNTGLTYYGNSFTPGSSGIYNVLGGSTRTDPNPGSSERVGGVTAATPITLFNAGQQGVAWEVLLMSSGDPSPSYARFMVYGNATAPSIEALEFGGTRTFTLSISGTDVQATCGNSIPTRYVWRKV